MPLLCFLLDDTWECMNRRLATIKIKGQLERQQLRPAAQLAALALLAAAFGVVVAWRAPGLSLQARDALVRTRGVLVAPDDMVIVAIDEASIARFGRFPWSRAVLANTLDKLAAAQPRAIALDVLFSEATNEKDDAALAAAIKRAGNVIVAAQLVNQNEERGERRATWLHPQSAFAQAAAGIGHVNLALDRDGVARTILLRQIDDAAQAYWTMAIETTRVGAGLTSADLRETPEAVNIGARVIPVQFDSVNLSVAATNDAPVETVRAARLAIDYGGPAGAFAVQTISVTDVLDGKFVAERLRGKYVLIGATAALGDRVVSPFTRAESADGNQNAAPLAGVEVLAHALNTILRARFYREASDGQAFWLAVLMAALTVGALTLAQGRFAGLQQLGAIAALLFGVWLTAYFAFVHWLIVLPVVPMLAACGATVPLVLLRRTLLASGQLDARLAELTNDNGAVLPSSVVILPSQLRPQPAALIARLSGAHAVAILARTPSGYRLLSDYGASLAGAESEPIALPHAPCASVGEALARPSAATEYFETGVPRGMFLRAATLKLEAAGTDLGALLVAFNAAEPPAVATLQLCRELATHYVALLSHDAGQAEGRGWLWRWLPHSLANKGQQLAQLQQRFLRRAGFVNRALHSMEDGLLVCGVDGFIAFANPRAAQIFGLSATALQGQELFDLTGLAQPASANELRDVLTRLLIERAPVEREITIGEAPPRYYCLRLAAVCEGIEQTGAVTGLVATLSDITRQRELQQMKNDVMALVTHELRTPLTAIQGMSEVLAQHEFTAAQQREMHQAINDEAKRLARMIDEYLNVARLEAGAQPLRRETVRVTTLLERTLLLLEPLARARGLRLVRRFAPNLPQLLGDADLLGRAVSNLVTNAIKYSEADGEVVIETGTTANELFIKVSDQGCGIAADELERIFEKFYRVPRIEESDAPGTGLGLPFVREVAELHGGRVTVASESGIGSVFTIRLPLNDAIEKKS